jgi:integrase
VHGTKKDAGRELTRLLKSQDEGAYVEPSKLSLGAYLSRWLADYATPRCSPKTVERWAEMVRLNITPAIGHHALSKLTRLDIQILYSELSKKLAAQTVLHVHRLLFQALRQAVKWDLLVRNPAEAVTPPHPKRTEMKVLKGAQMAALLDMTKASRLHVPIVLAVTCGMRRGEILALKWSDVDLEGGKLHVAESLEETKAGLRVKSTKSGRGRQVPMMAMTVAALRHHRAEQARVKLQVGGFYNPDGLVCCGLTGGFWKPSIFTDSFARLMKRLALPRVTFHELRHSHASLGLSSGVHPKIMSERLGHSTVSITLDTYSHVVPGLQEQAVATMEGALIAGK